MWAVTRPKNSTTFLPNLQIPQSQSPKPYNPHDSSLASDHRAEKQIPNPLNSPLEPHKPEPQPEFSALPIEKYVSHLNYDEGILSHFPLSFLALAYAQKSKIRAARKARDKAQAQIDKLQDRSGAYDHAYTYFHDLTGSEEHDFDAVVLKTRAFKARGDAEAELCEEKRIWEREFEGRFGWAEGVVLKQRAVVEEERVFVEGIRSSVLGRIAALSPRGVIPWGKSVTDLFPVSKLERVVSAREGFTDAEVLLETSTKPGSIAPLEVEQALHVAKRRFLDESKELWVEQVRVENERVVKENEKNEERIQFQKTRGNESAKKVTVCGRLVGWFSKR